MTEKELYEQALLHQTVHHCGAHPYEHGDKLAATIRLSHPAKILEIGTGVGYTAIAMGLSAPDATIDTLEKDTDHAQLAKELVEKFQLQSRIRIRVEAAEEYLSAIKTNYDFIFFDGFQIHYEFLPHYTRLLKPGGILFLANNHLQSKTSAKFFDELENTTDWVILERFADTTIAQRTAARVK